MAGEAEGRELTLHAHASRLTLHAYSCKGPERILNLQWGRGDEAAEDVLRDE